MEHFSNIEDVLSYYNAQFRNFSFRKQLKPFDCNSELKESYNKHNLNDFLLRYGEYYNKYRFGRITIIENKTRMIGYYSLLHDSLHVPMGDDEFASEIKLLIQNEPLDFQEQFQKQIEFPAIKIGHMAVDKNCQSRGVGTCLLQAIIGQIVNNKNWYGCQYLTVDSLNNPHTNNFYHKNGFKLVSTTDTYSSTRKMYLPLFDYFYV